MHFCAKNQNIHKPDSRGDLDHVQIHRLNVLDGVVTVVVVVLVGGLVVDWNPYTIPHIIPLYIPLG